MTLDLDELERKAKAANAGPWEARRRAHKDDWVIGNARMDVLAELRGPVTSANTLVQADAEHIAAANPSVVLALIERVRTLEQEARVRESTIDAGLSTLSGAGRVVLTQVEFDALTEACYTGPRLIPLPADEVDALSGLSPVARGEK